MSAQKERKENGAAPPVPSVPVSILQPALSGDAMELNLGSVAGLERSVQLAERYFAFIEKIRRLAVNATRKADWIDESGSPFLMSDGAYKIANAFGVTVSNMRFDPREDFSDEYGEWYLYTVHGVASWNGREQPQVGTCSTRDKFFAKRTKDNKNYYLPLSEICVGDVKKKAVTNLLSRAIKSQLGLDFTWDELEELSGGAIKKGAVTRIRHTAGAAGGRPEQNPDAIEKRNTARKLVLEMAGNNVDEYTKIVRTASAWTNKEGKHFDGKNSLKDVSDAAIPAVLNKILDMHTAWKEGQK